MAMTFGSVRTPTCAVYRLELGRLAKIEPTFSVAAPPFSFFDRCNIRCKDYSRNRPAGRTRRHTIRFHRLSLGSFLFLAIINLRFCPLLSPSTCSTLVASASGLNRSDSKYLIRYVESPRLPSCLDNSTILVINYYYFLLLVVEEVIS